jgi:hypothetical protein
VALQVIAVAAYASFYLFFSFVIFSLLYVALERVFRLWWNGNVCQFLSLREDGESEAE